MSKSINTGHALYGNIISLIAVDGGALVDLKSAKTFIVDAAASFGTAAPYGEYFRTSSAGGYTPKGASFTPAVAESPSTTDYTVLVVINAATGFGGGEGEVLGSTTSNNYFLTLGWKTNFAGVGRGPNALTYGTTTDVTGTGAHTLFTTKAAGDNQTMQLYVDNAAEASQSSGFTSASASFDYIGGYPGQGSVAGDIAYIVVFNKILNSTERGDLIASLGSNTFALINSTTNGTAPGATLTGTSTFTGGAATGAAAGTAPGATLTGTSTFTGGAATGVNFGTITTEPFYNWSNILQAGVTIPNVVAIKLSDRTTALSLANQVTNGSGQMVLVSSSLVAGTDYMLGTFSADGSACGFKKYTAT